MPIHHLIRRGDAGSSRLVDRPPGSKPRERVSAAQGGRSLLQAPLDEEEPERRPDSTCLHSPSSWLPGPTGNDAGRRWGASAGVRRRVLTAGWAPARPTRRLRRVQGTAQGIRYRRPPTVRRKPSHGRHDPERAGVDMPTIISRRTRCAAWETPSCPPRNRRLGPRLRLELRLRTAGRPVLGAAAASNKSKSPRSRRVSPEASTEPPSGFEPETYALRVRCSGQLS